MLFGSIITNMNLENISMQVIRKELGLEKFDRVVFESIVEKVIVGEATDDGTVDPFKLTLVMKGNANRLCWIMIWLRFMVMK